MIMDRRRFLVAGCTLCLGGTAITTLFDGCSSADVTGTINGSDLVVPLTAFQATRDGRSDFKSVITVRHPALLYPVCVYRFSATDYLALLMQCTHQGNELLVLGDRLACPAHGSEFNSRGSVIHGPADADLRTFPVTINDDQLRISLR